MTEPRPKLKLRLATTSPEEHLAKATALLSDAIAQKLCVRRAYNRLSVVAAPQILCRKNDGVYCDAVVVERDGKMPSEAKLASFNLAGLTLLKLTGNVAEPECQIHLSDPRYAGGILARLGG